MGLNHPIAIGTMIGEIARNKLITPRGAHAGDRVLLTKGVPIEATTILAREFPARLRGTFSATEIETAQNCLFDPGIGVTRDARLAIGAGHVTAMHDATEGGVVTALWELAEASGKTLRIDARSIQVSSLARRICAVFGMDPLCAIASGSLLLTVPESDAHTITEALLGAGIACADIGIVCEGPVMVERRTPPGYTFWPRPAADDITKAYA
jgi:hydrogenase maturation factor